MNERYDTKKILLVDDEIALVNLLEIALQKEQFRFIRKALNGLEAIEVCRSWHPELIILDIMLPDIDGFEVCRRIREFSTVPILFLSAKSEEIDRLISFAIGGDDYIMKPFSLREVMAHIKSIFRRMSYYELKMEKEETKSAFGEFVIDFKKKELFKSDKLVLLTPKEYLLLEYLVKNKNITVSKEQIVEAVWGGEYEGYDNTAMVHIRHLREKIEKEPSSPVYIKTIKGRGYRFDYE